MRPWLLSAIALACPFSVAGICLEQQDSYQGMLRDAGARNDVPRREWGGYGVTEGGTLALGTPGVRRE